MKEKGIKWGIRWSLGGQAGKVALNLLINIALIRILAPPFFGIMAMATVVNSFLSLFISLGTGVSLVYSDKITQKVLSSIFWLNFLTGLTLGTVFSLSGKYLALFFSEPILADISLYFGLNLCFQAIGVVPVAILQKKLLFNKLFWVELFPLVLSGGIAIIMAFHGWGIYSLVLYMLLKTGLTLIFSFHAVGWIPSRHFSFKEIKPHLNYGGPLMIDSLLNYAVRNIDDLLIGKFLGNNALGLYNKSYSILLFPLGNLSQVISRVLFPAFSINRGNKAQICIQYLKACEIISLLVFPFAALLFSVAEELVICVFGTQWSGAIPLIRIFSVLTAFQSIGTMSGVLFYSMGATRLQMQIGLFVKPFLIGMIVAGLLITQTTTGLAKFYTIGSILTLFPELFFAGGLIGLSLRNLLKKITFPFLFSLGGAFLIEICYNLYLSLEGEWMRLILKSGAFFVAYIMALRFGPGGQWQVISTFATNFFKNK